jgi:hypothetical protein
MFVHNFLFQTNDCGEPFGVGASSHCGPSSGHSDTSSSHATRDLNWNVSLVVGCRHCKKKIRIEMNVCVNVTFCVKECGGGFIPWIVKSSPIDGHARI